ncbi:MAG: Outer membrane protein assembly factor BamB [Firmicutes bacterium ADurb.Bin080]|nr:MAG: Outer membrane protein assembly factor BamB [Firmicutes bacterium ADurb.Bin080]
MTKYNIEEEIKEMLISGERVLFVAQQHRIKPGGSVVTPNKLYVTTHRIIFRNPYLLGIKKFYNDYYFKDISNIRMKKGAFSTEVYLKTRFLSDEVVLPAVDHKDALEITRHIRGRIGNLDNKESPSINININNAINDGTHKISSNINKSSEQIVSDSTYSISKGLNKYADVLFGIDLNEEIKSIRLLEPESDSADYLIFACSKKGYYLIDGKGKIIRQQKTGAELLSSDISIEDELIIVASDDLYLINYGENNDFISSNIEGVIKKSYISLNRNYILGLKDGEIHYYSISNIKNNAESNFREKILRWKSDITEEINDIAFSITEIYAISKNKLHFFTYLGSNTIDFTIESPKTDSILFIDSTKNLTNNKVIIATKKGLVYYINSVGEMEWCKEIQGEISNIYFSSDGMLIIVGTESGFLYFLDDRGDDIRVYEIEGRINSIKIASESKNVVVGSNLLYYFDSQGELLWFYDTKEKINAVDISSDGKIISIGSKSIILLDSMSKRPYNSSNIQREVLPKNAISLKTPVSGNNPNVINSDTVNALSCSQCGYSIQEDWINCPKCGNKLIMKCKKCGKELNQDWVMCPYCGNLDIR